MNSLVMFESLFLVELVATLVVGQTKKRTVRTNQILKAVLKRWDLSWVLNDGRESEFRMVSGREFQRVGAATAKALSPRVRYLALVMGVRRLWSAERSRRVGEWRRRRSVRYEGARLCRAL